MHGAADCERRAALVAAGGGTADYHLPSLEPIAVFGSLDTGLEELSENGPTPQSQPSRLAQSARTTAAPVENTDAELVAG